MVEIVLDGQRLLADPGFGMSVLHPIVLEDGVEEEQAGWRYRVRRAPGEEVAWEMHRLRDGGWELMHTSDELPVRPVDVVMGHHYTSTFPASHFRSTLMVTRHLDGRHLTVTADAVTVRRPGEPTEHRPLRDGELVDLLEELAVPLTDDERTGCWRSSRGSGVMADEGRALAAAVRRPRRAHACAPTSPGRPRRRGGTASSSGTTCAGWNRCERSADPWITLAAIATATSQGPDRPRGDTAGPPPAGQGRAGDGDPRPAQRRAAGARGGPGQ